LGIPDVVHFTGRLGLNGLFLIPLPEYSTAKTKNTIVEKIGITLILSGTVALGDVASPASGHVGTCPPWRLREFCSLGSTLKQIVWFGLVLCQTVTQHYLFSRIRYQNDTIKTGYNGACAIVVFTARRHALARSLLSAGVRPSVCPPRSCIVSRRLKISSNIFLGPVAP